MGRIRNKDIAEMVGVSRTAVTQVLNGSRLNCVSPEKRKEILRIAKENNYHPDFAAQVLGSGKTRTIGMPMPWMQNLTKTPSLSRFLSQLVPLLEKHGYLLSLLPVTNESSEAIYQNINMFLSSRRVDGLITNAQFLGPEAEKIIQTARIPVVTFALSSDQKQSFENIPGVGFDCDELLIDLSRRFASYGRTAMLYAPSHASDHRLSVFKSCPGLTFFELKRDYFFPIANAAAAMVFIRERWQELKEFPCWILQNDRFAYAAACVIREMELVPGKDILLAGFDNVEENSAEPFFTTVRDPFDQMAQACVDLLLKQLNSGTLSGKFIKIPSQIIYRASSAPVNPA
jgi:DNA-binding LacI/PurR family transcriptional regulator